MKLIKLTLFLLMVAPLLGNGQSPHTLIPLKNITLMPSDITQLED